ncbi:MAG: PH domain-containing protein, partial [Kineosporiaceae bacterium]
MLATTDGSWSRTHPLTPAIRLWQVVVVAVVVLGQEWGQGALAGDPTRSARGLSYLGGSVVVGVVAVALLVTIVSVVVTWRFTRYRITEDALELHHGVLSRRQRRARLDRIQAVDVVQPLVARVVGMARLTVEVAGGADSKVELSYLTQDQAERLRNDLLARAAGVRYVSAHAPQAPERGVVEVPLPRLLVSLVLSGPALVLLVLALGLGVVALVTGSVGPAAAVLPVGAAALGLLWRQLSAGFGFQVATSPDGVRLRHGLLEHRAQTVPPGRVQAVRLHQPLPWRGVDWWRVEVNVAGYGYGSRNDRGAGEHLLLPVGTRREAVAVLSLVLPDLGTGDPGRTWELVDAGLVGAGGAAGFVTDPPAARWVDPLSWRRNGVRVTDQALVIRRGWVHRVLDLVPHARTQSCGVKQGPLQRVLGLASFHLHSTPGPLHTVVPHLSARDA